MKEYAVSIAGIEHTLQLSDEDAKVRGLTAETSKTKKAAAPPNKSATAKNKSA